MVTKIASFKTTCIKTKTPTFCVGCSYLVGGVWRYLVTCKIQFHAFLCLNTMEIKNVNVEYLEDCSVESKDVANLYWELDSQNQFVNKPAQIKKAYNLRQHALNQIISQSSYLGFELECDECNEIKKLKVTSQTPFNQWVREASKSNSTFQCSSCKQAEIDREAIKAEEKREALQTRFKQALDEKKYENLSLFNKELLHNCLTKKFQDLKKHYEKRPGNRNFKQLFSGLYYLESMDLILLQRIENSNTVTDLAYLPRLKDEFTYEEPIPETKAPVVLKTKETSKLQIKLTPNHNGNHPDSPQHAGLVTFKKPIKIEADVEYTFAFWPRANGSLYLTLVPIDDIYPAPKQSSISNLPITLQEGIQEFLYNIKPEDL